MIRKFKPRDLDRVMQLWLEGNLDAHDFVPGDYWTSNAAAVSELLLQAELYVFELCGEIQGFAGMQDDYLAGIFVDKACRSMGIGKQLLEHIKKNHSVFTLNVYQRNRKAVEFYLREGLLVLGKSLDQDTGETEYTMQWSGR
ncbi:MAG: GNAT family N-acetyltransferase [Candidatus Heteroscillospira sp.]|jgi:putative acetyltransferase